jgi:hypothetical protein
VGMHVRENVVRHPSSFTWVKTAHIQKGDGMFRAYHPPLDVTPYVHCPMLDEVLTRW